MAVLFVVARRWRGMLCLMALVLSMALCLSSAYAETPLTLEQAVHRAIDRSPSLLARRARVQAAEQETHNAAALPDPKLTFGIQDLPVDTHDAFNPSVDSFTMKKIGLMQEIPARAKRQARQALADSTLEQANAMSVSETLAVRRLAAEAWVALWASQRDVESLQALREEAEIAVQIAKARLRGGTGTAADALAARGAQLELENRIDAATADVAAARATLGRWLGTEADRVTASGAPDFTQLPITESRLLATVDQQAPLLAWQAREKVAAAQLGAARAETRPDWSIGVSYAQRDRYSELASVEIGVSLPLFPGERQDHTTAARQADYEATLDEHEDARRMQAEQLGRDLANWHGLQRRVTRDEQQVLPLARDRTLAALAAYRGGGAIQAWLDARRDELEIHSTHVREDGELGRAWAALAYLLPKGATP